MLGRPFVYHAFSLWEHDQVSSFVTKQPAPQIQPSSLLIQISLNSRVFPHPKAA
jgi:hypothetical protein